MPNPAKITLTVDGVSYVVDGLGNVAKAGRDLSDAAHETGESVKGWGGIMSSVFGSFPAHVAEGMLVRDAIREVAGAAEEAVLELPHLVEKAIASGNAVYEMSLKTGASVEGLSSLKFVAGQTGIEFASFGTTLFKMEQALGASGAKADEMQKHLDVLHLNLQTLKNEKPDQAFIDIMVGLEGIPNRADQAATGMAIFGRGFKDMAGLTQESITDLIQKSKDLGLVMSTEAAAGAHAAEIGYKALEAQIGSVEMKIGRAFIPAVIGVEQALSDLLAKGIKEVNGGLNDMGGQGGFLNTVAGAMGSGSAAVLAQTKLYEYLRDALIGVARYGIEPMLTGFGFVMTEFNAAKVVAGDVMQVFDGVRLSFLGMRQAMSLGLLPGQVDLTQWKALDQQMADLELKMQARGKAIQADKAAESDWASGSKSAVATIEAAINTLGGAHIDVGHIIKELADISKNAYGGIGSDVSASSEAVKGLAAANQEAAAKTQGYWDDYHKETAAASRDALGSELANVATWYDAQYAEIVKSKADQAHKYDELLALNTDYYARLVVARQKSEEKQQADEAKAQQISLDTETKLTEQVWKLTEKLEADKRKALEATNQAVVKNLDDQLKYERDAGDEIARLTLSEKDYKIHALDAWLADERAKLQARKVYSQEAEDQLVALYQAKAQAIAAANDPIYQAWKGLNVDLRQDWANTWSQALQTHSGFVDALMDPWKKMEQAWLNVLGAMVADWETQLLGKLGMEIPGISGGSGGGYGGLMQAGVGMLRGGGSNTSVGSNFGQASEFNPDQVYGSSGGSGSGGGMGYGGAALGGALAGGAAMASGASAKAALAQVGVGAGIAAITAGMAAAQGGMIAAAAAAGAVSFGVGAAVVGVIALYEHMKGASDEEKEARKAFEDWDASAAKTFDTLATSAEKARAGTDNISKANILTQNSYLALGLSGNKAIHDVGVALDATHNSATDVKTATDAMSSAIKAYTTLLPIATKGEQDVVAQLSTLGSLSPQVQAALQAVYDSKNVGEYADAVGVVSGLLKDQATTTSTLTADLQKYGLSWTDAGEAAKNAKMGDVAKALRFDYDALRQAGVDGNVEMVAMKDNVNKFIADAQKAGVQVPNSMREVIQSAIDTGTAVDRNGQKITDITQLQLTFGDAGVLSQDAVTDAAKRLQDTLTNGLAGGFTSATDASAAAADAMTADLRRVQKAAEDAGHATSGYWNPTGALTGFLTGDGAATGGFVTASGIQHFARGGFVGGPRGTDTVPAWLTPGEVVLNKGQQQSVFGGTASLVQALRADNAALHAVVAKLGDKIERMMNAQPMWISHAVRMAR